MQGAHGIGTIRGRKAKVYGDGEQRTCGYFECGTVLSKYNPEKELCNQHAPFKSYRTRGSTSNKVRIKVPYPEKEEVTIWINKEEQ